MNDMNMPENTIVVGDARAITPAQILEQEYDRYNSGAFRLRQQSPSRTLVTFAAGARYKGDPAAEGTHDGIRDGASENWRLDTSRMLRYVCTAEDWTAAGNVLP